MATPQAITFLKGKILTCDREIKGILPKGPYMPCVSMAGRALLAGYHRSMPFYTILDEIKCLNIWHLNFWWTIIIIIVFFHLLFDESKFDISISFVMRQRLTKSIKSWQVTASFWFMKNVTQYVNVIIFMNSYSVKVNLYGSLLLIATS